MSCANKVYAPSITKIPTQTLVLPQPSYTTTHFNYVCQQVLTYPVEGGCNCANSSSTVANSPPQGALTPTQSNATVSYVILGSGFLFGSILDILLNDFERHVVQYNQQTYSLQIKPATIVKTTIIPPDNVHCTVRVGVTPISHTIVYIELGTGTNPTTNVRAVGYYKNLVAECITCPFPSYDQYYYPS